VDHFCYCNLCLDLMTFHIRKLTRISHGDILDVRKWPSYVKAFESYRITSSECVHLVTRGHVRSRDEDGGDTIRSVVVKNPRVQANIMTLCFIYLELLPTEVLHFENRDFRFISLLWPWHWPDDFHIRPVFSRDIMYVRVSTSYVKVCDRYCIDMTKIM